jgi:ornithine carbamoyltransferase
MSRSFLEIDDLSYGEVIDVLDRAEQGPGAIYAGRTVGLYFEKPSLRTRHSSEAAIVQLGGHPVTFFANEIGPASREPLTDIARVLSGYHAVLAGRVFDHATLETLASVATIPIINLLSDRAHPCQALADLLTMRQDFGELEGRTVAWLGDFNNVARSLAIGATMLGMRVRIASPGGYGPTDEDLDRIAAQGPAPLVTARPEEAVEGAWAVHTDTWTSMGQEDEAEARRRAFEGFAVDDKLMELAMPGALFMHCLPAHRGEEVWASVIDGPQSRVIPQAHNRMHAFRGLLSWFANEEGIA